VGNAVLAQLVEAAGWSNYFKSYALPGTDGSGFASTSDSAFETFDNRGFAVLIDPGFAGMDDICFAGMHYTEFAGMGNPGCACLAYRWWGNVNLFNHIKACLATVEACLATVDCAGSWQLVMALVLCVAVWRLGLCCVMLLGHRTARVSSFLRIM
jgi:hypothetical protein